MLYNETKAIAWKIDNASQVKENKKKEPKQFSVSNPIIFLENIYKSVILKKNQMQNKYDLFQAHCAFKELNRRNEMQCNHKKETSEQDQKA